VGGGAVGLGRARHRVLGGALAGPDRAGLLLVLLGRLDLQQRPVGSAPRPWFPSRRDPDDGGGGAHPNPKLTPGSCGSRRPPVGRSSGYCRRGHRVSSDSAAIGRRRRSVHFPVVCNATAVGCVAMGVKRDPAVRLCVTCGQLKCVACQQTQPSRADRPGKPHDPHAAVPARARPGAAACRAGTPGRLPDAVPGRMAGDTRHGSNHPGPQAGGQPRPQGTRAAAPLPPCRAVPGGVPASSVTTPFEAARPTGGHLRSAPDYARGRVDVAAEWGRPPPATPARGGSQTAGRTAGNPGTRRRPVRPRGTAVLGRWPTRCRQAVRGQVDIGPGRGGHPADHWRATWPQGGAPAAP
jgi:hypothetical protein